MSKVKRFYAVRISPQSGTHASIVACAAPEQRSKKQLVAVCSCHLPALFEKVRRTTRLSYCCTHLILDGSELNSMYASSKTTSTGSARMARTCRHAQPSGSADKGGARKALSNMPQSH
eukprot:1138703-Pelagomonas_calceolata.AAC.1